MKRARLNFNSVKSLAALDLVGPFLAKGPTCLPWILLPALRLGVDKPSERPLGRPEALVFHLLAPVVGLGGVVHA